MDDSYRNMSMFLYLVLIDYSTKYCLAVIMPDTILDIGDITVKKKSQIFLSSQNLRSNGSIFSIDYFPFSGFSFPIAYKINFNLFQVKRNKKHFGSMSFSNYCSISLHIFRKLTGIFHVLCVRAIYCYITNHTKT